MFDKPEMMNSKSPDLFSFTVTGLRDVIDRHGSKSTQTSDANDLVSNFINKVGQNESKISAK